MSFIATYRDWAAKDRLAINVSKIRQTNGYGWLVKPRTGQVIVLESAWFSGHMASGTGTDIPNVQLVVCDSSGNVGTIARTGTNTGTSATVATVSGGGMTVNAYVGMFLRYTSGTNNGKLRAISSNDATTITTATFTTAPANGDTFEVVNWMSIVPILPMWKWMREAAARAGTNVHHQDLEFELGEGAGIGYISRQQTVASNAYVQPTEFSIAVQARFKATSYRTGLYTVQPNGTLP